VNQQTNEPTNAYTASTAILATRATAADCQPLLLHTLPVSGPACIPVAVQSSRILHRDSTPASSVHSPPCLPPRPCHHCSPADHTNHDTAPPTKRNETTRHDTRRDETRRTIHIQPSTQSTRILDACTPDSRQKKEHNDRHQLTRTAFRIPHAMDVVAPRSGT
jgi:hypothetical protein